MAAPDEARLGAAIAMAAALKRRFGDCFVAKQCQALESQMARWQGAQRRLLGDGNGSSGLGVRIGGLDAVAELWHGLKPEGAIFAGSLFGPPFVCIAALSALGAKVAGVHWGLGQMQRQILAQNRVQAIDLAAQTNRFALVRRLQNMQADGHTLWLNCEASGQSRQRYKFLGYKVQCATLIELLARLSGAPVVPIYCRMLADAEVSVHCDAPLTDANNLTQRLLTKLETLIYDEPMNYLWDATSIVLSDPLAVFEGVRCLLPHPSVWRKRRARRNRAAARRPQ